MVNRNYNLTMKQEHSGILLWILNKKEITVSYNKISKCFSISHSICTVRYNKFGFIWSWIIKHVKLLCGAIVIKVIFMTVINLPMDYVLVQPSRSVVLCLVTNHVYVLGRENAHLTTFLCNIHNLWHLCGPSFGWVVQSEAASLWTYQQAQIKLHFRGQD